MLPTSPLNVEQNEYRVISKKTDASRLQVCVDLDFILDQTIPILDLVFISRAYSRKW